jgi:hypothetical protein
MQGTQKVRPLTHDLLAKILRALGTKIESVIVNDLKRTTYGREDRSGSAASLAVRASGQPQPGIWSRVMTAAAAYRSLICCTEFVTVPLSLKTNSAHAMKKSSGAARPTPAQ